MRTPEPRRGFGARGTRIKVACALAAPFVAAALGACSASYTCRQPVTQDACSAAVSRATTWLAESGLSVESRAKSVVAHEGPEEPNAGWNGLAEVRFDNLQANTSFSVTVCADDSRCSGFRPLYTGNLPGGS